MSWPCIRPLIGPNLTLDVKIHNIFTKNVHSVTNWRVIETMSFFLGKNRVVMRPKGPKYPPSTPFKESCNATHKFYLSGTVSAASLFAQ